MIVPMILVSGHAAIYNAAADAGDQYAKDILRPALSLVPATPLFRIYLLAALCSAIWIGRYSRITASFAVSSVGAASLAAILLGSDVAGLLRGDAARHLNEPAIEVIVVSLLLYVALPSLCYLLAAFQFATLSISHPRSGFPLRAEGPLWVFKDLARTRRQSYRKFSFVKLPVILVALFGQIVVIALLSQAVLFVLGNALSLPPYALRSIGAMHDYYNESAAHLLVGITRSVFSLATLAVAGAALTWWVRFAWRSIRRRATDVLADPRYRPVVFLRSFRDEDARVATKNPFWSLLRARVRLEEVIAGQMMRLGPCVAIGVPGEWAPKLGAMRAYFADADWQAAIRSWTNRAAVSVVMAGESPSVLWELEYLIWSNRASTLLMVLPPDASLEARARRWRAVSGVFAGTRWQQGVTTADVANVLCVTFEPDGTVMTVKGWPKHQIDYEVAVQTAVARLLAPAQAASRTA